MIVWKSEIEKLQSQLEELRSDVGKLSESPVRLDDALTELRGRVEDLAAQVAREKLSMAELYDKTYHLLKRHEARDRASRKEPEDAETGQLALVEEADTGTDPVTQRVLNRRRGGNGISPVVPR